jgi:hypothetical protein
MTLALDEVHGEGYGGEPIVNVITPVAVGSSLGMASESLGAGTVNFDGKSTEQRIQSDVAAGERQLVVCEDGFGVHEWVGPISSPGVEEWNVLVVGNPRQGCKDSLQPAMGP